MLRLQTLIILELRNELYSTFLFDLRLNINKLCTTHFTLACCYRIFKVVELVLLEARDQGALMFLHDELCDKGTNTLGGEQLDDVYLFVKAFACLLVALQALHTALVPRGAVEAAA